MNTVTIKLTDEQVAAIEEHRMRHLGAGLLAQPFTAASHPEHGTMRVTIVPASQIDRVSEVLKSVWDVRAKEQTEGGAA